MNKYSLQGKYTLLAVAALALSACGGGGGGSSTPTSNIVTVSPSLGKFSAGAHVFRVHRYRPATCENDLWELGRPVRTPRSKLILLVPDLTVLFALRAQCGRDVRAPSRRSTFSSN